MKRTTLTMTLAAAALLTAAATSNAQSMKAEIPFAFDAAHARMQAGNYQVRLVTNAGAVPTVRIYGADSGRAVLALPMISDDHAKGGTDPVLTFQCTDGRCSLAKLWDGEGRLYTFATPKAGEGTRIATVVLQHERGE
jgi:hypothetical protein